MERLLVQADRLHEQLKVQGSEITEADLDKMVEAYDKVVEKAPPLNSMTDIQSASEDLKQAWAIRSLAVTRIGSLYLEHRNYDKAYENFKLVSEFPTTNAQQKNAVISYMAVAMEKSGRFQEASALYDSLAAGYLIILTPENPNMDALDAPIKSADMWARLGNRVEHARKLAEAENFYKALIIKYKGTLMEAGAVGKLASAYLQQLRFIDAIDILKTVRDDSTGFVSPGVQMTIADIFMNRLMDHRSAEIAYRDCLSHYPGDDKAPSAQLGLGLALFEQTKYPEARRAVQGVEKIPRVQQKIVAQAYFLTALCYEKEDKWEIAKGQFDIVRTSFIGTEQSFEAALHIPNYYRRRGMTDLEQKAFESAVQFIKSYAEENSANPLAESRALGYLVRAYTEKEDYPASVDQLVILHDRFPQFPEGKLAPLRLGEIYETVLGDTTKAIGWLKIFVNENPDANNIAQIKAHIQDLETSSTQTTG
jgi:tetratricopeptide (TPR) repeat protein